MKNDRSEKQKRTKSLHKKQKTKITNIKNENSPVYQKLVKRQIQYLKNYRNHCKENNIQQYEKLKEKGKISSRDYYNNNSEKILEQRRVIRYKKKDEDFERFLNDNIIEEIFEKNLI